MDLKRANGTYEYSQVQKKPSKAKLIEKCSIPFSDKTESLNGDLSGK